MAWPFSKRKRFSSGSAGPAELASGSFNSPGFASLISDLERRRPSGGILDLGPPSTENVEFLSQYSDRVTVQDLFRAAGEGDGNLRTLAAEQLPLPDDKEAYDAILVWDLFHYMNRAVLPAFAGRLARLCRPDAVVLISVTATLPVPPQPLQFKIEARDRLFYTVTSELRTETPQFTLRSVEQAMRAFDPLRVYQLRNGFQECLFRHRQKADDQEPARGSRPIQSR